jgi:hypothetical protein
MVTITSAPSHSQDLPQASGVSRAIGSIRTTAPSASAMALSAKMFEATIWSGRVFARHHQFIAGGDQRDDRAARAPWRAQFIAASSARSAGRKPARGGQVKPGVKSRPWQGGYWCRGPVLSPRVMQVAVTGDILLHRSPGRRRRHRRAGEDAQRLTRADRAGVRRPGLRGADHRKHMAGGTGPHRIAIHRRCIERAAGRARAMAARQHPTRRHGQRHRLGQARRRARARTRASASATGIMGAGDEPARLAALFQDKPDVADFMDFSTALTMS